MHWWILHKAQNMEWLRKQGQFWFHVDFKGVMQESDKQMATLFQDKALEKIHTIDKN